MKKSKEFLINRAKNGTKCLSLKYINKKTVALAPLFGHLSFLGNICHSTFKRFFEIHVEPGQTKRIRITIEEVKC